MHGIIISYCICVKLSKDIAIFLVIYNWSVTKFSSLIFLWQNTIGDTHEWLCLTIDNIYGLTLVRDGGRF